MRKIICLFLSFFIFCASFTSAYAGLPQAVTSYAVTITNVVKTGVGASANFFFKKAANDPSFASPAASVTNKSMATGFIKRFAKFGLAAVGYLVIEKLLEGTDWVMGEGGQITRPSPIVNNYSFCPTTSFSETNCYRSPSQYLKEYTKNQYVNHDGNIYSNVTFKKLESQKPVQDVSSLLVPYAPVSIEYTYDYSTDSNPNVTTYPNNVNAYVVHAPDTYGEEIMTADELANMIKNAPVEDLANLIQPQPNVAPAEDPAYDDLYASPAADAVPDTNVDPNPDTGECPTGYTKDGNLCLQNPVTDPETPPIPEGLPAFCSWATPVCDFIDWVKEDPETSESDSDVVDVDDLPPTGKASDYDINYINFDSQCPVLPSVNIGILSSSSSLTFDMTPLCDMAIKIRPVVVAIAYFIGLGVIASAIRET